MKITVVDSRATATVTAKASDVAAGPIESDVWLEKRGSRWLIANF
jgi:hypothetical protein